jgi:DNA-binding HxlR family transcriptional regulator
MSRRVKREARLNLSLYAKEYLKRDWSVTAADPITKAPIPAEWKEFQSRHMTETEIAVYFREGINVGVICGHISNDLIMMDFDDMRLSDLWKAAHPPTLMFATGKGTRFLYHKTGSYPTHHLKPKGIEVDILGEGGFSVMPPSYHVQKKKNYRWLNEGTPIMDYEGDFLEDLYAICSEDDEYKKKLDAIDFFREKIDIDQLLLGVEEGGRDNAAIRVASWYRKGGLSPELVLKKLLDWNLKNKPPMSESQIEAKVKSAFKPPKPYFFFTHIPTSRDLEEKEELTPEIRSFLEKPNLMDEVILILDIPIVGERQLKSLVFLCNLSSVITDKPFGVLVIDIFGSGKSYVLRCVVSIFPKERTDQPTSISYQTVNYLADNYQGRVLRVDELFGLEEGMEYIRVWMTEGRLERWIVNADTGQVEKRRTEGCPCILTSTVKNVEEQYGSRNWIAHVDTSRLQTKGVHHAQYVADAVPEDLNPKEKQRTDFLTHVIRWLMQNAKPVLIPFRYSFPTNPRSRRDKPKFQLLIKAICNLHQLQRKTVTFSGKTYLIAETTDFETALQITEPFLRSSVMTLDKDALAILDYLRALGMKEEVNTKELLLALNMKHATLHRRLETLEQQGFIEFAEEPKRGTPSTYRLTEAGIKDASVDQVKITDDGQWMRDLYGKLNDPETLQIIKVTSSRIWRAEQEEEEKLADLQKHELVELVKQLHEKQKAKKPKDDPDWKKRRINNEDEGGM